MTIGSENLGNGSVTPDRLAGKYRGARRDGVLGDDGPPGQDLGSHDSEAAELGSTAAVDRPPKLPSLDLDGLTEPVYPPSDWTEPQIESLVDHPLLRGLLLELPSKGSMPRQEWLDRWFEAARAILELLYVQDAGRPR
ncbi:hypothetical protein [Micromonospora sp. NBC_01796]|uniref:hypothetical protein n=1 Tax=Micromonospora sp. NBC_01796 TaxID=2975987 RepID=UPI002DDB5D80|nr:hypothetical protein [Micromonospora sp. NBC_01796]WSA88634.1 hypothetical protein OIE47_14085 [Micromonospora sp. NBC_01796]